VSGSSGPTVALGGATQPSATRAGATSGLPPWWPLAAITILAAILRLSTLGQQSFWYDEAFTPVHVLRPGLVATLHNVVHTENTPPLWYVLEWALSRVLGTGVLALRLLSALAGIATVPLAWLIGRELAGRRAAVATATFVAVNPLLVWYSQEARAYGLFVLTASLALLCFLRALRDPSTRHLAEFATCASLALLSHYFAVFLLVPMVMWLLWGAAPTGPQREGAPRVRPANPKKLSRLLTAVALPVAVGLALIPLILAQGGHGTQWIGEWALPSRLEAIAQYYLTGYTGAALGHGIELLVALVLLAGFARGLWCTLTPREERGALIVLTVLAGGVLIPVALAFAGVDYLAPRNLVAAMVPLSALLAIVIVAQRSGRAGVGFAALGALAFLALTIDIDLSPRLQRGDWSGVASVLHSPAPGAHVGAGANATEGARASGGAGATAAASPAASTIAGGGAIVTAQLGSAPLEYYLPALHELAPHVRVRVSEIDEVGYAPLRRGSESPPARGFHLAQRRDVHGLIVYRFTSPVPVEVSAEALVGDAITEESRAQVLVPTASSPKTH
jgi:mannosyltransferase